MSKTWFGMSEEAFNKACIKAARKACIEQEKLLKEAQK